MGNHGTVRSSLAVVDGSLAGKSGRPVGAKNVEGSNGGSSGNPATTVPGTFEQLRHPRPCNRVAWEREREIDRGRRVGTAIRDDMLATIEFVERFQFVAEDWSNVF